MLYITIPWLTYFITGSLYLLLPFIYFAQPPPFSPIAEIFDTEGLLDRYEWKFIKHLLYTKHHE